VVVAVGAVRVVQVALDQVVDVIAVGHCFVAATGAVLVARLMTAAAMGRRAVGRVGAADRQRVFLNGAGLGRVVQVAVVEVIGMTVVLDGRVAAAGAVLVRMAGLGVRLAHGISSLGSARPRRRFQFRGVSQRVLDQTGNVLVCQSVKQVRSLTAAADQPFAAKDAQSLRHGREFLPQRAHNFARAPLAFQQKLKDVQPRGVSHRSKKPCRPFQRNLVVGRSARWANRVFRGIALRGRHVHTEGQSVVVGYHISIIHKILDYKSAVN